MFNNLFNLDSKTTFKEKKSKKIKIINKIINKKLECTININDSELY
jgi:hypothetical protein